MNHHKLHRTITMRNSCEDAIAWSSPSLTGNADYAYQMLTQPDSGSQHHLQIDSASELNNHAIIMMQSGRLEEAIHTFQAALNVICDSYLMPSHHSVVIACLSLESWKSMGLTMPLLATMAGNPSIMIQHQTPSIQSCPVSSTSQVSVAEHKDLVWSPHNCFSIYNRAFCIVDEQVSSERWLRRLRLLPAVILYNMGLSHQLIALQNVSNEAYQKIAFQYYEMALHAADHVPRSDFGTSDYNLLVMALSNNMGFIASHEFNEPQSLYFAGRMLTTFAMMDCAKLLIKDEYVFYYMNLLFVLSRYPVFAPAA
ncbi:hypothetical protein MPSEU_000195400 [Mayamaea pseudoterrestris]|nr:hypothetical protein MPSEU_000195400 [Mayamaea pseudoterrestris]